MGHLAFLIVNKNGSLVYSKIFSQTMQQTLSTNDIIRLSSTFHSMHAISSQIVPDAARTPENPILSEQLFKGFNEIVTQCFTLKCLQTTTAIKFMLVSNEPHRIAEQESILQRIYEVYSDYVNKNPFQEQDMPIKSELFDERVLAFF